MSRPGTLALFLAAASVVGVAADRYSKNARGEVVETRPAFVVESSPIVAVRDVEPRGVPEAGAIPMLVDLGDDGPLLPTTTNLLVANVTEANRETLRVATAEAARLRPIRAAPVIRRVDSWRCRVEAGADATIYTQGGVTRAITASFPCPVQGEARMRWGSGVDTWIECAGCNPPRQIQIGVARQIVVTYPEGDVSVSEVWPTEVTP